MKIHPEDAEQGIEAADPFFREVQVEFLIHELKNPVSIIETGVRALLEKREKTGPLTERQEKTLNRVLRNSVKIREMLETLMEVGRSDAGSILCDRFLPAKAVCHSLLDALETVDGTVQDRFEQCQGSDEEIALFARCGVFLDVAPSILQEQMHQDETKFRRIVVNLFNNALHHRKNRIDVKMLKEDDRFCIEVSDDGPGVAAEHHQAVFRRYVQVGDNPSSARKGHGLGLAGARIMARRLGGDIQIRSEKGKGATFRLTLPLTLEGFLEKTK